MGRQTALETNGETGRSGAEVSKHGYIMCKSATKKHTKAQGCTVKKRPPIDFSVGQLDQVGARMDYAHIFKRVSEACSPSQAH